MLARSTMPVEEIEISQTTVYLRKNIKRVESELFTGYEYEEKQLPKDEFIGNLIQENKEVNARVGLTESAIDFLIMSGGEL